MATFFGKLFSKRSTTTPGTFEVDKVDRATIPLPKRSTTTTPGTFEVDEVDRATIPLPVSDWKSSVTARCNYVEPEAFSQPTNGRTPLGSGMIHGFLNAVHLAYSEHYPLVISPDDIWMCIVQGFAAHVNANAEKLRHLFVEHEGKKIIKVRRDDFVKGAFENPWPEVFSEFSAQIRSHIGDKTHDILTPNFTTTGPVEKAAAEVVLMNAFKEYFDYRFYTDCGIPEITLRGTVDDWKQLRERALGLAQFELQWWTDALKPILDQFVAASEGHVDKGFWSNLYKYNGGSGGPYISGWIVDLFPYLGSNHVIRNWCIGSSEGVTTANFPPGIVDTPFIWEYYGTELKMHFYAGFMGASQNSTTLGIHSEIGWAVVADEEVQNALSKKPYL